MAKKYDYVIVGGGPSGLTCSWILANIGKKILLVERDSDIGGCHAVRRVNDGYFTEHGPRIYTGAYETFRMIFRDMGFNFHDFFTPYDFSISGIINDALFKFKTSEIFWLVYYFFKFIFNQKFALDNSMGYIMKMHNFSEFTYDFIDRMCRLSDGAGADRYTIFEFYHLLNQNYLYKIYQPRSPNDLALFRAWEDKLLSTGNVDILKDTKCTKLFGSLNNTSSILLQSKNKGPFIFSNFDNVILAVPPRPILKILTSSSIQFQNAFMEYNKFKVWEKKVRYLTYIPITFHWNRKINMGKVWGSPVNDWAIGSIPLSNYMKFKHPNSSTLITVCIANPDAKSKFTGKTAHQSSEKEMINETFRQLKTIYPNLPPPTKSILSPGIYQTIDENGNKIWDTMDDAYIRTPKSALLPLASSKIKNLYNVGTHNGKQKYHFTALESAASNSVALCKLLHPQETIKYSIIAPWTLNHIFIGLLFTIIVIIFLYPQFSPFASLPLSLPFSS